MKCREIMFPNTTVLVTRKEDNYLKNYQKPQLFLYKVQIIYHHKDIQTRYRI